MALGECVVKINEVTEGILDKLGARIKGAAQGIQKSYNARQQANAIQQRQATAQKKVQQKAALNDPKAKDAILDQIVDNIVRNPKEREKFDKMLELLSQQGHNQKGVINTNDIGSTVAKIYPDPNIKPAMIDFVSQRLVSRGFKVNNQRVAQRNAPTGPASSSSNKNKTFLQQFEIVDDDPITVQWKNQHFQRKDGTGDWVNFPAGKPVSQQMIQALDKVSPPDTPIASTPHTGKKLITVTDRNNVVWNYNDEDRNWYAPTGDLVDDPEDIKKLNKAAEVQFQNRQMAQR